jgi:carboxyl-terminal processing protease
VGREAVELRPFRLMPDPRQRLATPGDGRPSGDAGLRLSDREDGMMVEDVMPGSPAARLGLKPGDRISAVGGRDVSGMGTVAAAMLLRGPIGSTIEIALAGPTGARTVSLQRAANPALASGR